jgi:Mlc titration factor MtfA (ptsG expression regulator)
MLEWIRRRRRQRTLLRRAIPHAVWAQTLAQFPFLAWREVADVERLRVMATLFLADKEFTGTRGFEVDDAKAVAIAAQACLPVLRLGLEYYDSFVGIVVHADAVVAQREVMDEDGIVHAYEEELSGEAMQGGPIMLSWSDVQAGAADASLGYNVVIHEFAHVLSMRGGRSDGVPRLPNRTEREVWARALGELYDAYCDAVDELADGVLDPYAAHSIEEFFAVASEAFFVAPLRLEHEMAELYALLRDLYGQDPSQHCPG